MTLKKIIVGLILAAGLSGGAAATAKAEQHNDGRAEAVGKIIVGAAGAAAGAAAGTVAGKAATAAAAVMFQSIGEGAGAAAGRYLDRRADENRQTGRGGADDLRYDPRSLFNQ